LTKRLDDIPLLVDYFIDEFCRTQGKAKMSITKEAIEELQKIKWTGNIRELRNVVERLVILCEGGVIKEDIQRYAVQ
jgi:DNA-binding NtrC family response regulator